MATILDIQNLQVTYGIHEAVSGVNMQIEEGKITAIIGSNGAGKTTIINLLMRFYDVDGGAVYVDEQDIRTVTRASLRKGYTMVLQDTWLFHGTIFDNIAYGKPDAPREEVIRAAKLANAHEFIMKQPDGYNTYVGDKGSTLSGGESQRIRLATQIGSSLML